MTYMTKHTDMALGNIQELSFNEVEEIAGGPLPAAIAACAANPACVAGVRVGAAAATVAIIAAVDYFF